MLLVGGLSLLAATGTNPRWLSEVPVGRIRLLVTPLSATMVLAPKLVQFASRYPDIVLDVSTTQEGRTELVAAGFDAGHSVFAIRKPLQRCGQRDNVEFASARITVLEWSACCG